MKTFLFVDGTNLFMGLYDLFGVRDIPRFRDLLKDINRVQKVDKIFFYASYMLPRNNSAKEKELLETEALFYKGVKEISGLYFYKGHRSPTSGKEKGVDVHLALDLVYNAFLKKCNQVVIVTGDADLVYSLEIAKKFGARTHGIFLPTRFALGISYMADKATVLNYLGKFKLSEREMPKKLKILELGGIKKTPHASTRGK
ncbi:MAG: NYN domain-containing protein [Patescibacteria group bacterium]|nr:NYN domain-containing protein [Patescibacteria group bacterium]